MSPSVWLNLVLVQGRRGTGYALQGLFVRVVKPFGFCVVERVFGISGERLWY